MLRYIDIGTDIAFLSMIRFFAMDDNMCTFKTLLGAVMLSNLFRLFRLPLIFSLVTFFPSICFATPVYNFIQVSTGETLATLEGSGSGSYSFNEVDFNFQRAGLDLLGLSTVFDSAFGEAVDDGAGGLMGNYFQDLGSMTDSVHGITTRLSYDQGLDWIRHNDTDTYVYGDWTMSSAYPVPEPTTILLFGTGLIGLAGARRKLKK